MHKYRTLKAWQTVHHLALPVLDVTDRAYSPRARPVLDQLRRAASVEANVVEGYALGTTPQFRRHLRIAIGSAAEAECMARLAGERGYLQASHVTAIERQVDDALGLLIGLWRKPISIRVRPLPSVARKSTDGTAPGSQRE